jgi:hypothetical protein
MKFWTSADDLKFLQESLDKRLKEGPDQKLHFLIGFFTAAYAIVELRITLMLAKATKITQLQSFDLLTRGMDIKTKIERLRRASEKESLLGPNLIARLNIVDDYIRPLRNKVAHTYAVLDATETKLHFATLVALPKTSATRHPEATDPETIEAFELFEAAAWLRLLNAELSEAYRWQAHTGKFEIIHPRSPLRRGSGQSHDQPKTAAKLGRRERKRERKGQPLRRKERK